MKSSKTEPAPPPFETRMASAGATIPCAPAGACATIQPEPWEYAPVPTLPPPGESPAEALPGRRLPVGKLLLAAGIVAFAAVGYRAVAVTSEPVAEAPTPAPTPVASPTRVFVDVDAIIVRATAAAAPGAFEASAASTEAPSARDRADLGSLTVTSPPVDSSPILPAGALDLGALHDAPARPTSGRAEEPRGAASPGHRAPLAHRRRRQRARAVATQRLVEGRAAQAPRVRTELDARAVAAVVTRQHHHLERCYERALTRAGVARSQALRLVVRIGPEGGVSAARVEGADLPSLAGCLEGVARGWAFPESRSGAEVPIPLRFTPQA